LDFRTAFDCIDQSVAWAVLESYGVDSKLIHLLNDISCNAVAAVRVFGELGNWGLVWYQQRYKTRRSNLKYVQAYNETKYSVIYFFKKKKNQINFLFSLSYSKGILFKK